MIGAIERAQELAADTPGAWIRQQFENPADDAKDYARRSASQEGLLVGISSGATLAAIASKLPGLKPGARVLDFNYDTRERYLSVPDFLPA